MSAPEPLCPYTGLRTFTEDEAIYFRGREAHIGRCVAQLAQAHFLMITGASGDGKSSLVFAGLLPEIRAGFFRARYGSWAVCTFRPERNPLQNLALALAPVLQLEQPDTVETALSQGFAALVDLYQTSVLCPPEAGPDQPLRPAADLRRQAGRAANLLLVVDQFEEFFTNAENYAGDAPTAAAQTVVNLLLETTRLARERGLPIYVLCTMRSDYIGQCAEFRGLAEAIGKSQYFVPRLTRPELVEVVREPAVLSGNRIAERLVQRLVDDTRDGRDQLPVLQHALYQIWQAARQGSEELDLLHYAMVGGISATELPAADQARFAAWRAQLPAAEAEFLLARPALRNVLDAHANRLFANAEAAYNRDFTPVLLPGAAARALEATFRGLTKVDAGRVVRNRLTGAELTAILDDPALPWPVVCRVLRPFRQPGNTFVLPFLAGGDDNTAVLPPDAVLDITHESLIRNWQRLADWAQDEAQQVHTLHEAVAQATRWQSQGETAGYLLPIGLYNYFGTWHQRQRPSASWLANYVETASDLAERQTQAVQKTTVLRRFLGASRRKLWFSLFVQRYGAGRLAASLAAVVALVAGVFFYQHWRRQQTDYVLYSALNSQLPSNILVPQITLDEKADLIINAHRLRGDLYTPWLQSADPDRYAFQTTLDNLHNDTLALDLELKMFERCANYDYPNREADNPLAWQLLIDLAARLTQAGFPAAAAPVTATERHLVPRAGRYVMACAYFLSYHPDDRSDLRPRQQAYLETLRRYLEREIAEGNGAAPNMVSFSYCLRVVLSQGNFAGPQLAFLGGLSPFKPASRMAFARFFPATAAASERHSGFVSYAYIATALGEEEALAQCLDSVAKRSKYTVYAEGGNSVLPYLIKYQRFGPSSIHGILKKCSSSSKTSFALTYAAFCYHLLSEHPTKKILDYSALNFVDSNTQSELGRDLCSFSVSYESRERAWAAALLAIPEFALLEANLWGRNTGPLDQTKAELMYLTFSNKMRGIYQASFRHDPDGASLYFDRFSRAYNILMQLGGKQAEIFLQDWTLAYTDTGIWRGDSDYLPVSEFLLGTSQPATVSYGTFRPCSFVPFMRYLADTEVFKASVAPTLVHLLDSAAYAEVVWPSAAGADEYRSYGLGDGLDRQQRVLPDTLLLNEWAVLNQAAWSTAERTERNQFLLKLVKWTQNPAQLRRLNVARDVLPGLRRFVDARLPWRIPLRVALTDVAVALVAQGRVGEAIQLVEALPGERANIAKTILGNQLMLNASTRPDAKNLLPSQVVFLDSFLRQRTRYLSQHLKGVPAGLILLYFWNPGYSPATQAQHQQFGDLAITEADAYRSPIRELLLANVFNDHMEAAVRAVPAYSSKNQNQAYYNLIFSSVAYCAARLPNRAPATGWREYDLSWLSKQSYNSDRQSGIDY